MERIKRKSRYVYAIRDSRGRFVSVSGSQKKIKKPVLKKAKKARDIVIYKKESKKRQAKNATKKLSRKDILDKNRFTYVDEYRMKRPIKDRKGVMVIRFLFTKVTKKRIISDEQDGYSNKMYFPKDYDRGFNLCLRRAMSKINFSPDSIKPIKWSYNYYIPKKERFL